MSCPRKETLEGRQQKVALEEEISENQCGSGGLSAGESATLMESDECESALENYTNEPRVNEKLDLSLFLLQFPL